jgi:hypothetical protein
MKKLRLPEFTLTTREEEGRTLVFDPIRKKYLVLTPEEWVRQHMVGLLVHHLGYPVGRIRIEGGHVLQGMAKRTDIVVYDEQVRPFLLVECKADTVPINQKAVDQLVIYNRSLNAPYVVLTNGLVLFCFQAGPQGLMALDAIPSFKKN